jgi:hypothetical protein
MYLGASQSAAALHVQICEGGTHDAGSELPPADERSFKTTALKFGFSATLIEKKGRKECLR